VTDNSRVIAVTSAIAHLLRLRQLGVEIEANAVEDLQFERARALATRVNASIRTNRVRTRTGIEAWRAESAQRNLIETTEREADARDVRERVAAVRTREAKRARTAHGARVAKLKMEKEFAIHFVSVSRQVAQESETRHRKEEEQKAFAKVRAGTEIARQEAIGAKVSHRNTMREVTEKRQETAKHERALVEDKREYQRARHEGTMERVRDWRAESRAIKAAWRSGRGTVSVFYPNAAPRVDTDPEEGAAMCIGQFVGEALGQVEARLLVDLLASIV
jgi:hypothetical protein